MLKKIFLAFTSKERRTFLITSGIFLVSLASLAGLIFATKTKVVPAQGGDYTEGFVGQPSFVEPVFASTEIDRSLVRLLFANMDALAEKIDQEENGRVWRVRLKERLSWSDGHKLTSDDVIFTIQKIQESNGASPLAKTWQGVIPNRLSELEVQFTLSAPLPTFNENLRTLYPVPKHLFAEIPPANWRLSDYNLKPIGSGPYVFNEFEKQSSGFLSSYRLTINPRYAGEKAHVATLHIQFFANVEQLIAGFNSGAVDGIALQDPEVLKNVKRPYQSISYRLPIYYAVFMNQSQNLALKDPAVREALSLKAPREQLIKDIFNGHALPAVSPAIPGTNETNAYTLPQDDPATLLESAGWHVASSGIREKTIKTTVIPLSFTLTVPQAPFAIQTAEALKSAWKNIGADVTIAVVPFGPQLDETIKNRNYQAILYGNTPNPSFNLYPFWSSNERFSPGLNLSLYSNKKADTLLEGISKIADPSKRSESLSEVSRIIASDFPAVFLYSPDYLYLANKSLQGVSASLVREPADRFLKMSDWYLETKRTWE